MMRFRLSLAALLFVAACAVGPASEAGLDGSTDAAGASQRLVVPRSAAMFGFPTGPVNATSLVGLPVPAPTPTGAELTVGAGPNLEWDVPAAGVMLSSTTPANVSVSAAAVGVGGTAARADHVHLLPTGIPNANLANSSLTIAAGTGMSVSGCSPVSLGGTCTPSVMYGSSSSTATVGNDSRLAPTPTAANKLLYDTGSAYAETAACGSSSTVMVGGSPPACGLVPAAAITALTGSITGTYTLAGTPTISSPAISSPVLSGSATGTYTIGGSPTFPANVMLTGNAQTLTAQKTFPAAGSTAVVIPALRQTSAGNDITVPVASGADSMCLLAQTQTITNKSIDGASNTLTNVPVSSFTGAGLTANSLLYVDSAGAYHQGIAKIDNVPTGGAIALRFVSPVTTGTNYVTALAANSAGNSFTVTTATMDVCRAPLASFGAGWDGGDLTVVGTNCKGTAQTVTMTSNPGSTFLSGAPLATITSVTKATVGASAATATIQASNRLGWSATRADNGKAQVFTNQVLEASVSAGNGVCNLSCPFVEPTSQANGSRTFVIYSGMP